MLRDFFLYGLIRGAFAAELGRDLPDHPEPIHHLQSQYPHVIRLRYLVWDTIDGYRQKVWVEGWWNIVSNQFSFFLKDIGSAPIRKIKGAEFALLCQLQVKPGGTVRDLTSEAFQSYFDGLP